jgi:glycosyltransferase involved in cell wall biosynthesis
MNTERFAFIIPVYNHERGVAQVARDAVSLGMPVFVIDDGSTDLSYEKVRDIKDVTVLRHGENKGKGEAIMTGFAAAAKVADWAITVDADGQHHPEDALVMMKAIESGMRPIVVGRREGMSAAEVPWESRFGRLFSNFWVRLSGGPHVSDTQSGMRIYPLPESMNLNVQTRRFQFEVEILVRAAWKGMQVMEAPVNVTYQPPAQRISHFRGFVDSMRNASTFTRLIVMRIFIPRSLRVR